MMLLKSSLHDAIDDPEFDYANMDTSDYAKSVDQYFGERTGFITIKEALDVLLITYAETNMKDINEIEEKSKNGNILDEVEEEKLFFKEHLNIFFREKYKGQELTVEKIKDIIKKNEILISLEDKMKEEDYNGYDETDDNNIDNEDIEHEDDEFYDTQDDLADTLNDDIDLEMEDI